jgi:hypothetical protein
MIICNSRLKPTRTWSYQQKYPEKFLLTKFEFGGSFGTILEGDCQELEVSLDLELLIIFVMSFIHNSAQAHTQFGGTQKFFEKNFLPLIIILS